MKYSITIDVYAVRATSDQHIVFDGGSFTVKAGDWLVEGNGFGPTTFTDEEIKALDLVSDEVSEKLSQALETGYI